MYNTLGFVIIQDGEARDVVMETTSIRVSIIL